jgi:hypothetical protein
MRGMEGQKWQSRTLSPELATHGLFSATASPFWRRRIGATPINAPGAQPNCWNRWKRASGPRPQATRRTKRPDLATTSIDSKSVARPGMLNGGFVRANRMSVAAMRTPQGKLQRTQAGQHLRRCLNLGFHLAVGRGTAIHEHGLTPLIAGTSNSGPGRRAPDDVTSCLGITSAVFDLVC